MRVAIVGGGAAGFFAAINIKEFSPEVDVVIYESSSTPLSKVRVSGGGRCNLTNSFEGVESLSKVYPRGEKLMRHALKVFSQRDTYSWFESRGVRLITQSDECVFPASQSSEEIISTFGRLAYELSVKIKCGSRVQSIVREESGFLLTTAEGTCHYDKVVVTTGGSPQQSGLSFLGELPLKYIPPTPSLFSLRVLESITDLQGIVVEGVGVALKGTKFRASGALLITHWGVSGPAILRLSSYASRHLAEANYRGAIIVNWAGETKEDALRREITSVMTQMSRRLVSSASVLGLPSRLWGYIMNRADISPQRRWAEIGSKGVNRIVATIMSDEYTITSKSNHAEEFVTCGGVDVKCINPTTMQARECEGLYLAGEVLDVDAITGGFNLQAAWSMAYVVARSISVLGN